MSSTTKKRNLKTKKIIFGKNLGPRKTVLTKKSYNARMYKYPLIMSKGIKVHQGLSSDGHGFKIGQS